MPKRPCNRAISWLSASAVLVLGASARVGPAADRAATRRGRRRGDLPDGPSTTEIRTPCVAEVDRCPDEAEVYDGVADDDGVPEAAAPRGEIQGPITAIISARRASTPARAPGALDHGPGVSPSARSPEDRSAHDRGPHRRAWRGGVEPAPEPGAGRASCAMSWCVAASRRRGFRPWASASAARSRRASGRASGTAIDASPSS